MHLWQEYQERLIDIKKDFAKWLNKNDLRIIPSSLLKGITSILKDKLSEFEVAYEINAFGISMRLTFSL